MKLIYFSITIVILTFIISGIFYPILPEKIISHWNAQGIADGYSGKLFGLFLIPVISLILLILFSFLPKLDPLKENIKKFQRYYDLFILLFATFMLSFNILIILANLGFIVNILFFLMPAFGILFFLMGLIMEKTKRNWFIGIRTPWTLSDDRVWDKTHKLGGRLFEISGILSLFGIFFIKYAIWFILVPVLLSAIISVVYSYLVYRKIKR